MAIIHCLQFVYHAQSGQGCLCVAAIFHHFRVKNKTVHLILFNIFCIAGIADVWSLPPMAKFTLYLSPLLKSLLFWFSGNKLLNFSLLTHFKANLLASTCLRSLRFCKFRVSKAWLYPLYSSFKIILQATL